MIASEQRTRNLTVPTTQQGSLDEQPQSQIQLTHRDQSLAEHDQNEYDQFQNDHSLIGSRAIQRGQIPVQSPQSHCDQSQNQAIQSGETLSKVHKAIYIQIWVCCHSCMCANFNIVYYFQSKLMKLK